MSFYADNGRISTAPIPGGIAISETEYRQLLSGMLGGQKVEIVNGMAVLVSPPEAPPVVPDEPQEEPVPDPKAELLAYVAEARWLFETAGVEVVLSSDNTTIGVPTDDRAKSLIAAAADILADDQVIDFKAYTGFVTVTGAEIRAFRAIIASRIQVLFSTERVLAEAVEAGTVTTNEAVDAAYDAALAQWSTQNQYVQEPPA